MEFDREKLQELADSIQQNGLLTPIVVEDTGDPISLIAGERRWRAHQLLGKTEIEAIVKPPMNGTGTLDRAILALVENLQRADLNPIEEGRAYQRLKAMGLSNAAIAHRLGSNPTRIAHRLSLLETDEEVQDLFAANALPIDQRVVNAILNVPVEHQVEFARKVARPGVKIKTIQAAADKLNRAIAADRLQKDPGLHLAVKRAGQPVRPKWDAMHQLGKVLPWQTVEASAHYTCETCALRGEASVVVCGSCPLVVMLARMIETVREYPANEHQRTH